jgi:uncharacterized pyridoxamine 5'-phosphate oxidase family protein
MEIETFEEIQGDLEARVRRIVWCTVATVDRQSRPRVRMLHPVWEGSTAYICTGRNSHKAQHLAINPYVSLSYWDAQHEQVYADCEATWVDDAAEKKRIWDLFKSEEEPYGYDPAMFWPDGPEEETFGVLKCEPWRLELAGMTPEAFESRVWRP